MRIFATGASGRIGSAVVPELLTAGHLVPGLARSDAAAGKAAAIGAEVRRGDLDVHRRPERTGAEQRQLPGVTRLLAGLRADRRMGAVDDPAGFAIAR